MFRSHDSPILLPLFIFIVCLFEGPAQSKADADTPQCSKLKSVPEAVISSLASSISLSALSEASLRRIIVSSERVVALDLIEEGHVAWATSRAAVWLLANQAWRLVTRATLPDVMHL